MIIRVLMILLIFVMLAIIFGGWHANFGFLFHDGRWWKWLLSGLSRSSAVPAPVLYPVLAGWGVGVVGFVALGTWAYRTRSSTLSGGFSQDSVHGTARWASMRDVKKAGLLAKDGVVVGSFKGKALRHDGPEHVLAFAPTRSGKGVSLVLPTLLSWQHSAFVLDIKGENWALSSGWRAAIGQRILKFDPTAREGSAHFNPLAEVRLGAPEEVADAQSLASVVIAPDGACKGKGSDSYFESAGTAWLVAVMLYTLHKEKQHKGATACLSDIGETLADTESLESLYDDMEGFDYPEKATSSLIKQAVNDMRNREGGELSGVLNTATTALALFRDPILARNTAQSDFTIDDLVNGEKPTSLYLVIPPHAIDRLRPLTRLILNLIITRLASTMAFENGAAKQAHKHRLLLMLDEFTSIGRLETFESALAFIAGYGLKAYLIIQDLSQLYKHYTREQSIIPNCHLRLAFAPNTTETARALSEMAGKATIVQKKRSLSIAKGGRSVSDSLNETSRPLLTPDEAMRLSGMERRGNTTKPGAMLIFPAGANPIRGTQDLYFRNPTLRQRAALPPVAEPKGSFA